MARFVNNARSIEVKEAYSHSVGMYNYDRPSEYLFSWSWLLQAVVSQAGTYLLSKKFNTTGRVGIFKTEGGCVIEGYGDLVLIRNCCYFDHQRGNSPESGQLAKLISDIVLGFDPMDPIESILSVAAASAGCEKNKLKEVIENNSGRGPFGGDALCDFFDWNPFADPPDQREYKRYCWVELLKNKTDKEVDQIFADQDLGKELQNKLREEFKAQGNRFYLYSCSPRRDSAGNLSFWINTGRSTQLDGSKTLEEINIFLATHEKLVDKAEY